MGQVHQLVGDLAEK